MAYDYETLYRTTKDALGAPIQDVVDFFAARSGQRLRVLDIGCGQGRDALFIGRAGHRVLGVDLAPSGIRDLTDAAARDGLDVCGIVADITAWEPLGAFDVVLIDRTLHMLAAADRLRVLEALLGHVAPDGWCLIADEPRNIDDFRRLASSGRGKWEMAAPRKGCLFLHRI